MYLRRRIGSTIFGSLVIFLLILTTSGAGFTYAIDSSYDDQPAIIETESPYHTPPQDVVVTRQHSGNQILMYNTFEARDEALKTLPDASIGIVYQLIPAIAVRNIDPQDITKANLVSITPDMKFQRQANSEETISIDRIATDVGAFSLAQTAQMIGVNYLREVEELTGKGITIAILDSGVNDSLNSFTTVERIVVQDLADSGSEDLDGHGTHVTGIAAGNGNFFLDGKWVETDSTGMAPEASILSVRVLDDIGVGDNSWILEGIEKAILAGVDIISMSLSTVLYEGPNDPMQRMVDMAIANGTVVVAAAGNTGPIGSAIGIPGALDGVIAVGASFPQNVEQQELWSFSGIGPATNEYPGPDFIAPGAKILSVNAGTGELRQLSGTSMAAPHVSGGIALLMQKFPQATGNQIREALMASSQLSFN
ncbi:MAG: S8 family peptidase, partial [Candidatus Kariarchaeaceae archaeon]